MSWEASLKHIKGPAVLLGLLLLVGVSLAIAQKKWGLSETDVSDIAFLAALLIIFVPQIIWLIGYVVWLQASDEFRDRIRKKYPSIGNFYR